MQARPQSQVCRCCTCSTASITRSSLGLVPPMLTTALKGDTEHITTSAECQARNVISKKAYWSPFFLMRLRSLTLLYKDKILSLSLSLSLDNLFPLTQSKSSHDKKEVVNQESYKEKVGRQNGIGTSFCLISSWNSNSTSSQISLLLHTTGGFHLSQDTQAQELGGVCIYLTKPMF